MWLDGVTFILNGTPQIIVQGCQIAAPKWLTHIGFADDNAIFANSAQNASVDSTVLKTNVVNILLFNNITAISGSFLSKTGLLTKIRTIKWQVFRTSAFNGRLKLISSQISHEPSVTIHEISIGWNKILMADPVYYPRSFYS